jgi:hypothetical protein
MQRIRSGGYSELIRAAHALIPEPICGLVQADFLCGTDPVFAGLHRYDAIADGRSYRNTAHVAYDFHQGGLPRARRRVTVVLPGRPEKTRLWAVVHELGHVLHAHLGFEHDAWPVTEYAETNRFEAFAEAFTAWVLPHPAYRGAQERLLSYDPATVALFEGLG